ncbi:putative protein kinase [Plasmopara halstedii]
MRKVGMSEASFLVLDEESSPKDTTVPHSHRTLDALRQASAVELHRSSSGRNLRLKHISLADGALLSAPNALTPRAPSARRPGSRERPCSANCNQSRAISNNENIFERSSSFSIAAHVLKDLEKSRSSTASDASIEINEQPERCADHQDQRDDSSDESDEVCWDSCEDLSQSKSDRFSHLDFAVQEEVIQVEDKAVSSFGLWNKAVKNKSLPDAIIFSQSSLEDPNVNVKCLDSTSSSNRIESLKADENPSILMPSEMVSQLHLSHPHLAALSVLDIPKSMSLTRSTSPRIGRSSFSSLPENLFRRDASSSTTNQEIITSSEINPTVQVSNPIIQWKRGELIGEGTFGKVYKGLNIVTGELFALKEIEIRCSPNIDQVTQMQKLGEEISLMNNLNHKHIVRYKGSHQTKNYFYIFMEYVPGGSIASMLKQFDAFSEDLIRLFTRQIVQGVAYLHKMGVIHRDIKGLHDCLKVVGINYISSLPFRSKPGANVLVNEQGVSKLADFGCSKQIPQILTTSLEESLRSIRGSIPWMAPEIVKQTGHGYKADIWSIGATVIEMATAKHPWPHCHNGLAAMYTIAMASAPPPLPDHLSPEAKSFLGRCFCIDPEGRATAIELAEHAFLAEKR